LTLQIAQDRSLRTIDPQNGHMTVEQSYISKANVCPYKGREIPNWQGLGLDPDRTYKLLRSPDELARGADSASNLPLLVRHVPIHAEKPSRDLWVGTTGTVTYEHPYLVSRPLKVWTQEAIDLIESEAQRELSSGYGYVADMTPGNYEGQWFDGVMRSIQFNHVAIVSQGRVGSDVHVADEQPPEFKSMKHSSLIDKIKAFLKPDTDLLALDTIFEVASTSPSAAKDAEREEKEKAEDAENDCYGRASDEWEKMSAEDKKSARDAFQNALDKKMGKDKKGGKDAKGKDADPDHRKDFNSEKEGGADAAITMDQLNAAIATATTETRKQAMADARREAHATAVAREAVKPIVGIIALDAAGMDNADAIYGFALKQAGVKIDGVPSAAYPAMIELVKSRKAAAPPMALDSASLAHNVESIFRKRT
jgi:hypothetical protein